MKLYNNSHNGALSVKAQWCRGMIPALGAGGHGFKSRLSQCNFNLLFFLILERDVFKKIMMSRNVQSNDNANISKYEYFEPPPLQFIPLCYTFRDSCCMGEYDA